MELKDHQLAVNNNQVDTASDRPLTRSEPAEVVRLRIEVEFQLARTADEQERQQLPWELKDTSFTEDEKSPIERWDDCERQARRSVAVTEFWSRILPCRLWLETIPPHSLPV